MRFVAVLWLESADTSRQVGGIVTSMLGRNGTKLPPAPPAASIFMGKGDFKGGIRYHDHPFSLVVLLLLLFSFVLHCWTATHFLWWQ